jgi:hypothetical protein
VSATNLLCESARRWERSPTGKPEATYTYQKDIKKNDDNNEDKQNPEMKEKHLGTKIQGQPNKNVHEKWFKSQLKAKGSYQLPREQSNSGSRAENTLRMRPACGKK